MAHHVSRHACYLYAVLYRRRRRRPGPGRARGRASAPQAKGFRFPGFAAHYQDYEPSLDHYGFMRTVTLPHFPDLPLGKISLKEASLLYCRAWTTC